MKNKVLTLLTASLLFTSTVAQQAYEPTQDNLKTRKEFQDDKFGIFNTTKKLGGHYTKR